MIRQILGAVSQYERAMISIRLRSGRKRKAVEGGYAFGAPPFGQQAVDRELVVHDSEQRVIARMRRLRSAGRSYREIAAQLNNEGMSAKRGGEWHPMTVRRILQR